MPGGRGSGLANLFALRKIGLWDFSLEQVGIDVSAPCAHESDSLDDNLAKHARMKKTRSLCVM